MDEPPNWAARQPWKDRKRRELDNILRASGLVARDLADKYQDLPVGSEKRNKVFREHDDWVDGLYADVDRQEAAVKAFAKSRRIDPDAVMVGLNGDFAIAQETRRERAEARLSHRKAYAQRHGLVPPVRGPAAIEAAAADGEPVVIEGVARLPKGEMCTVQDMLYYDQDFVNTLITGRMSNLFPCLNRYIDQGVGNGKRQGTKIKLVAYEFRLNIASLHQSYVSRGTYSWAGTPGIPATTRTIPPVEVPGSTDLCQYEDSNGAWANSMTNYDMVYNVITPLGPDSGFVGPAAVCGSGGLPITETNLAKAVTTSAVTLQPQQAGVVNQPGFPVLPSWTAPDAIVRNGYLAGKLPTFRVMLVYDRFGMEANYELGYQAFSWFDVIENSSIYDQPPTTGLYNVKNLNRFEILYDTLWHPPNDNSEMTIVCPPKEIRLETVYNKDPLSLDQVQSGALYFLVGSSDDFTIIPPGPSRYIISSGTFRVFYEDY